MTSHLWCAIRDYNLTTFSEYPNTARQQRNPSHSFTCIDLLSLFDRFYDLLDDWIDAVFSFRNLACRDLRTHPRRSMSKDWADLFVEASLIMWLLLLCLTVLWSYRAVSRWRSSSFEQPMPRDRADLVARGQDALRRRHRL